jgi:hypothetical protein
MPEVVCRFCQQVGEVHILQIVGKMAEIEDEIDHDDDCKIKLGREKTQQPRHLRKKKWRKQERRASKILDLHETPASGALNEDGDARTMHGVRLECKQTSSETYALNAFVWNKLIRGARQSDETPILQVEIHESGRAARFYVFPQGSYDIESEELNQKNVRRGLHLRAPLAARTPFHVTTLDPIPVVVTESQLLEAIRDTD